MNIITEFLKFLSPKEKILYFLLIFGAIINVVLEVFSIGLVIPLIGFILNPDKMLDKFFQYFPKIENYQISDIINNSNFLNIFITIFVLIFIIKNIYILFYFFYQTKFIMHLEGALSKRILRKIVEQNYDFFIKNHTAALISKIDNDVTIFCRLLAGNLILFISELLIIVGFLTIIILFNLTKVFFIFLFFFVFGIFLIRIISKLSKKWGKDRKIADVEKLNSLTTIISNIRNIILDNKYKSLVNKFSDTTNKLASVHKKIAFTNIIPKLTFETIGIISISLVIYYLISNDYSKEHIITTTGFFIAVAYRIIPCMQKIIISYQNISYSKVSAKELFETLSLSKKVHYSDEIINFKKNVILSDVSFSHNERSKLIFDNANLTIEKGKIAGVYGESGAGKSTLVDIISCLRSINKGKVFIDNIEMNNPEIIRKWQNEISYVSQNTVLFKDTLRNNIIFSSNKDQINHELLDKTIIEAQLDSFIDTLPNKLDTDVGELGVKLSGGQRQRIGIARALYKQPNFLIFDEATNALDSRSENLIMETIFNLKLETTILIISHKKSLIERCDKIYEIKDGKIFEKKKSI